MGRWQTALSHGLHGNGPALDERGVGEQNLVKKGCFVKIHFQKIYFGKICFQKDKVKESVTTKTGKGKEQKNNNKS